MLPLPFYSEIYVDCLVIQAPFTRYRIHFISDLGWQSDMIIFSVYIIPFSFHIGSGFCLHDTVSLCTAVVSLYALSVNCTFCAAPLMNARLVELIMRFRIELPDSTVDTISDWFHAAFSFENAKRYEAYRIGVFSCEQEANLK